MKRLDAATINAVRQNIKIAKAQADYVIIDGRRVGLSHGMAIRAVHAQVRAGRMAGIKELRILTSTGEYVWTP